MAAGLGGQLCCNHSVAKRARAQSRAHSSVWLRPPEPGRRIRQLPGYDVDRVAGDASVVDPFGSVKSRGALLMARHSIQNVNDVLVLLRECAVRDLLGVERAYERASVLDQQMLPAGTSLWTRTNIVVLGFVPKTVPPEHEAQIVILTFMPLKQEPADDVRDIPPGVPIVGHDLPDVDASLRSEGQALAVVALLPLG